MSEDKVIVENVNHPGRVGRVDAAKYHAMRQALLKTAPRKAPGATYEEMLDGLLPHLDAELFPQGETSGWWLKTVQLDLEAKGILVRDGGRPLRWRRA